MANIPFMNVLSFTFLLFASHCVALVFVLPHAKIAEQRGWRFDAILRTSWPVMGLTILLFTFSDVIIDPVALAEGAMVLGKNLWICHEGIYVVAPFAYFAGWAVVGLVSVAAYRWLERGRYATDAIPREIVRHELFLGIGLY